MKILLINPNTTETVTQRAVQAAQTVSGPETEIDGVTGAFGAPIINSETDMVVGAHSAVDLAARHVDGYDAVGLAVSFDTGLSALREMLSVPVAGMAESAIRSAREHGRQIALVSFGKRTIPLYERLALRYLDRQSLAGVRCMDALSSEQLNDAAYVQQRIALEVEKTLSEINCDVIILLATAFAGLCRKQDYQVPVIDAVEAMMTELESAATDPKIAARLTDPLQPERKTMQGVSDELAAYYLGFPS